MGMNYLIIWTVRPGQYEKSIGMFAKHVHAQGFISSLGVKGIEVSASLHALSQARGFITAKVSDITAIQTLVLLLRDVYDLELVQVLTDEESARALAPLAK